MQQEFCKDNQSDKNPREIQLLKPENARVIII